MLSYQSTFIYYLVAINILAYLLMAYDKYQARNNNSRVPERTLFLLAFFCGALGVYLGMKPPIYHKAGKPKFKFLIPCLMLLQCVLLLYLHQKLGLL